MFESFHRHTTGKRVLALFIFANAVYLFMLKVSIPALMGFSDGLPIFDMSPTGYTYQQAIQLLSALGSDGRKYYLTTQLPLDTLYPPLFALCYASLLVWLTKVGKLKSLIWQYLSLLPLIVGALDYAENLCIYLMLNQYPMLSESLVEKSSVFTMAKSLTTMVVFSALLAALLAVLFNRAFGRNKVTAS